MRSLAAAYAVLALLATPALLWANEDPPAPATPTVPEAATPPAEPEAAEPAPAQPAPADQPSASPSAAPPTVEPPPTDPPTGPPAPGAARAAKAPAARAAGAGGVTIVDFAFSPRTITVDVGDTVTWTNRDGAAHTATADDGSFDTGLLERGESASQRFDEPGTFPYHCTPHPNMTATVVVRGSSAGSAGGGGSGSSGAAGDPAATPQAGAAAGSSGSTLPATGLQAGALLLGGVALLAAGALLRRRVED